MTILRQLIQTVKNAAAEPDKAIFVDSHLLGNGICCFEADSPDIVGQTIGIFLNDRNAVTAIGLKNLRRMGSADLMTLQKEHDILDLLLLLPAAFDPVNPYLSDPFHLKKFIRPLLYDI